MKTKITIGMLVILLAMPFVAADACMVVLTDGQSIQINSQTSWYCEHTYCQICIDPATLYYHPGQCNELCDSSIELNSTLDITTPTVNLFSPVEGDLYTDKTVLIDLNVDEKVSLQYRDNTENPRWRNLCSGCSQYTGTRNFAEGSNDITIRAVDGAGNEAYLDVMFYVDSKAPRIRDNEPTDGFASGEFFVEFEESNPDDLIIDYGNSFEGFRQHHVDLENECNSNGDLHQCTTQVNLADFDGQEIEYTFTITDIAGQTDQDGEDELLVDNSYPVINSIDYELDGRNVYFTIDVDEAFLDEVTVMDNLDDRPREKRLCSRLDNGICEKKVSFKDGNHDVTITVRDEAGHTTAQSVQFFTDSDDPKIRSTEPSRGFTSGLFEIEFEEENPISITLEYGNYQTGTRTNSLDLTECYHDDEDYYCSTQVDLTDFDGQEIEYTFTVTDRVGQTDEDGEDDLKVDNSYPIINSIDYILSGSKAEVTLSVIEENLDEITYINTNDARPRERKFCSRLDDEGKCDKKISLNDGANNIQFIAIDEAGHQTVESLSINL